MPGYGKSEFNDALIEDFFDYMGRMLDQFLSAIGIDEAVDLIGNSLGGQAALGLELHNPKRIKHLVLIGSQPTSAGIVIQPQPQEALNNIINYYAGEGPSLEKMRRLVESLLYDASLVTEETLNERFEASRDPGQMRLLGLPRRDLYSDLNEIAVATLLVWGHEDKGGALEVGLQMMKLMQNARMHIFQRCGHWAQVEHQEEFEQLVLNFLKS
jgi:pimeloyl-ACP methyl ester carboxylesterase